MEGLFEIFLFVCLEVDVMGEMAEYYENLEWLENDVPGPNFDIWTTKDGRKIPINKLDIDHLINIIKMVLRTGSFYYQKTLVMYYDGEVNASDASQMSIRWEVEGLEDMGVVDFLLMDRLSCRYMLRPLWKEAIKRELNLSAFRRYAEYYSQRAALLILNKTFKHLLS